MPQLLDFASAAAPLRAALQTVRRHLVWSALFSALVNVLYLAPTLYMLQVYDRVVPTRGGMTLIFLTFVLLLAVATMALLDFTRSRLLVRASVRLNRALAGTLLTASLAPGARDAMNKQVMREFDALRQSLTGPAIVAMFDAPWTPLYILVCFIIHPLIGVLGLVSAAVIIAVAWRNERATQGPLRRANEAANRSYVSQEQTAVGAEVIRALGMRPAVVRRHLAERERMIALQADASFSASRYVALSKFLRTALQSLALGAGALLAIDGNISGGAIFASSFLLGRALAPVDQILGGWRSIVQAREAYATIDQLLKAQPERLSPTLLPAPKGRVDVEHLVVLSPAGDRPIIADISFQMLPGEVVAVVGPSGAGKSTLARAIAGAVAPARGFIRFDGADRTDWDPEYLARHLGYLPQDASLFSGTVKENIARFQEGDAPGETDRDVVSAAIQCGAHEMILRLPNAYDTMLGWGGSGLSSGQAQRIALARALYGVPSVLLLDEPNAHLDAEGEAGLVEAVRAVKERGSSVMLIAHRMGIMSVVDKIMVLNNGRIEAFGARDAILERLRGPASRSLPENEGVQ